MLSLILSLGDYFKDIEGREGELIGELLFFVIIAYLIYRGYKYFKNKHAKKSKDDLTPENR